VVDAPLCMPLMPVANSAAYAGPQEINDLRLAIGRIGTESLGRIALAQQSGLLFSAGSEGFGLSASDCWEGSLAGAIGAELIATRFQCCDPKVAFTAGLLRDCGTLIIDRVAGSKTIQSTLVAADELTAPECEQRAYGFDHAQLGTALGELRFP
jgi:HD-like signal output (HDOD) protein